jgi:hypothetical protein
MAVQSRAIALLSTESSITLTKLNHTKRRSGKSNLHERKLLAVNLLRAAKVSDIIRYTNIFALGVPVNGDHEAIQMANSAG